MLKSLRAAALVLPLLLTACAGIAIEPQTDFNAEFGFAGVQKVALLPFERTNPTEIALTENQADQVSTTLAAELVQKGYQVVQERSNADVWLAWHLVTQPRTDVHEYNNATLYSCWRCGPAMSQIEVDRYTQGTFIVDIIDPVSNQSVWRSVVETRLKPEPSQALDDERRRNAARLVLGQFPPQ